VLAKVIRPAVSRAGITKRIGWRTFRYTYSTMLIANGENVKVVQEVIVMPTVAALWIYLQARVSAKHEAQQRLTQMILGDDELASDINFSEDYPDERLGGNESVF
jgi:site-specific recombinase XerD